MPFDPILQGPLPAPRDSLKSGGEKLNAMLEEIYGQLDSYATGLSVTAIGISTANSAAANQAAFEAFLDGENIAPTRNEYKTARTLIFPLDDDPYDFVGEIDIRRTIRLIGGGPTQRTIGSPRLRFQSGEYAMRFHFVELNDPVAGGWWSQVQDLIFEPVSAGAVDYGIINNCPVHFVRVTSQNFRYGCFLAAGQSSGNHDVPGPHETGGDTTVLGSVNLTSYYDCSARGATEGHGFIATGNIAGIVDHSSCNANLNNGCGFRDNSAIGCRYVNIHTAQNTRKITHHGGTTGSTTDATGYAIDATTINLASAGTGSIEVNDLVSFDNGDTTRYLVTDGDDDVANGGSLTISTRISAGGTIEAGTGLKVAIPASATAVTVYKFYAPIKDNTSGASSEPGVGVDWQEYWVPVTGQIADGAWTTSTFYWATGGLNNIAGGANHVNVGQYSEGGQEVGYVPRGSGFAYGGNLWGAIGPLGRAYIGPDATSANFPTNTPTWQSSDGIHSWGSGLGTGFTASAAFACGHTADTDVNSATPNKGGLQISYSTARNSWELSKSTSTRALAISGPGYSRSGYTQSGLLIAERGICFGGMNGTSGTPSTAMGRLLSYDDRAAIPNGTVLVKGDMLVYRNAASAAAVIEVVITGATTSGGGAGATIETLVTRP